MIASLLLALAVQPARLPQRALWVWHGHPFIESAKAREEFFTFLEAPKGRAESRVSVIFLSRMGVEDPAKVGPIGDLIEEAHRKGIRVDYLCGDAEYVTDKKRKEGLWELNYALTYNRSATASRRFDGIQFDVEPYMLPGWPSAALRAQYLDFLSVCNAKIKMSGQSLKLGVAIPRWFDAQDLHGLYKEVLDRVDYVAVMDYVDNSKAFVSDAKNTVAYATEHGKEVWLGAEATELKDEPMATFYQKGNAAMEDAFHSADQAFKSQKGYAGVAVEYYETYRALRP